MSLLEALKRVREMHIPMARNAYYTLTTNMEYTMRDCAFAGATLVSETYTDCAQKGILGSGMCQYCEARAALLGAT